MNSNEIFFTKDGQPVMLFTSKSSIALKKEKLIGKEVELLSIKDTKVLSKGKIKSIDNRHLTIINPDGIEQVYDILTIIVKILPLIEQIVMFFKRIFSKKN